jgi:hypothetical protein
MSESPAIHSEQDERKEPFPCVLDLSPLAMHFLAAITGGRDDLAAKKIADLIEEIAWDDAVAHASERLH